MSYQSDDGWLNGGLPFIDHVFDGKTGREIAREALRKWAAEREVERRLDAVISDMRGLNVKWITREEMLREWPDK